MRALRAGTEPPKRLVEFTRVAVPTWDIRPLPDGLALAIRQFLLLEMGPWPFNIMGLFVVLSLFIPAFMWVIRAVPRVGTR